MSPSRSGCLPARRCRFPGLIRSTFLALPLSLLVLVSPTVAQEPDQDVPVTAVGGPVHADLFTGAATTSIPIDVPPGRGGVQPNLALVYTSASRNGWVGLGWKLDKGVIDRQTKFGLNYSGDDYIFRLAGINVELVNTGTDEYRAKVEGRFTRVQKKTASDSKPYFLATDKTGTKFYFGQAATTRVAHPTDATKIFRWCLDRVEDPHGNYMTLSYTRHQGQAYLARIDYTGHGRTAPTNRVLFHLEDRTDAGPLYTTNFLMKTAKRLKTIEVKANNSLVRAYKLTYTSSAGTRRSLLSRVQTYGSNATVATNGNVTGGTTLPPMRLTYAAEERGTFTAGPEGRPVSSGAYGGSGWERGLGDVNGDGRTDVVFHYASTSSTGIRVRALLSDGDGTFTATAADETPVASGIYGSDDWTRGLADVNGDGRTDLVLHKASASSTGIKVRVLLSDGDGTFTATAADETPVASGIYGSADWARGLADVNGDGRTDLVLHKASASSTGVKVRVLLSDGDGTFTATAADETPVASGIYGSADWARGLADVNGDGRTDLVVHYASASSTGVKVRVLLSDGDGTFTATAADETPVASGIYGSADWARGLADMNGDGRADLVVHYASASSPGIKVRVLLSKGDGTFTASGEVTPVSSGLYGHDLSYTPWQRTFADVNGDGRADLVVHHASTYEFNFKVYSGIGMQVLLSDGDGTFTASPLVTPIISSGLGGARGTWPRGLADVNGDGRTDLVAHYADGSNGGIKVRAFVSTSAAHGRLTSITNGLGATTTIAYTPSTNYTNTQLPSPIYTVSSITINDGNGNVATTWYTYSGGYRHLGEREFRGFNYVKVTGPAGASGEQTITATWFHQGNDTAVGVNNPNVADGYLQGAPYRTKVTDGRGNVYTETTTTYTADANGAAPYYAPPASVVTKICEGNTCGKTTRTDYTYDAYGNVTQEVHRGDTSTTTDDRTVVRTYSPNTTKWIVSLPTRERLHAGVSATGTKLAQTDLYYDGTTTCTVAATNQAPTHGNLTRTVRWLSGATTSPETRMAYDAKGNRLCTRDANGHTTTLAYDSSGTFVTTRTNPKRQVTTIAYYGVNGVATTHGLYGQVKSVTDANGAVVTTQYDALGRRTKVTQPDGFWTTTSYVRFGTVGSQHVRTNSQLGLSTWTYFDGLGRPIKTERTGPENKKTVTRTEYDKRGAVTRTGVLADVTSTVITPPPAPQLGLAAGTVTVAEGGTATIRVLLTAAPTGTVTVRASESDADISLSPASRSFTTANWNTYQTFTVTGVHDSDTVADSATVTLRASGGGVSDSASVTVTITDDDTATPTPTPAISGTGVSSDPYVIPTNLLNTEIDCTRLPNWSNLTNSGAFFRFTVPTTGTWTATFTFAPSPKRVAFDGAFDTSTSTNVASPITATASLTAGATANFDVDPYVFTLGTLTRATLRVEVPTPTPTPTPAISGTGVSSDPYVIPPSLLNTDIDCTRLPNWSNLTNSGAFFRFTVPTTGTLTATFAFAPSPKRVAFDGAFNTSTSTAVASPITATASLTAGATANFDVDPYVFTLGTLTSATLRVELSTGSTQPTVTYSDSTPALGAQVTATLSSTSGVSAYRWQYQRPSQSTWNNSNSTGARTRTITFGSSGLLGYKYRLTWTRSGTRESAPNYVTVTSGSTSVTSVTANAGADKSVTSGGTVTLNGSASVTNGSGSTTYSWRRATGIGGSLSASNVAQPTFNAPTLTSGTADRTIVYRLTVTNNGVSDTDDVRVAVTAPSAPLVFGPVGNLRWAWSGPAHEDPIFNIYRRRNFRATWDRPNTGGAPTLYRYQVGSAPEGTTTMTSLDPLYIYNNVSSIAFRVRAENATGIGPWSSVTITYSESTQPTVTYSATTPAPGSRVTATFSSTTGVTSYRWQYSSNSGSTWTNSGRPGNTTRTLTVSNNAGTWYRISWLRGGVREYATTHLVVTAQRPPGPPGSPTLVSRTATSLTLQSTAPTTGGTPATYRWRYSTNRTVTDSDPNVTSSGPTVTISHLIPNRNYWVDVRAENIAGNSSYSSDLATSTVAVPTGTNLGTLNRGTTITRSGSITVGETQDVYAGTIGAQALITVTVSGFTGEFRVEVVQAGGTSFDSGTSPIGRYGKGTITLDPGAFSIRIIPVNSNTSAYTLTVNLASEVPSAPGQVASLAVASESPNWRVTWTAPTTGGTITGYQIGSFHTTGRFWSIERFVDASTLVYLHSRADSIAKFRVRAWSGLLAGPWREVETGL